MTEATTLRSLLSKFEIRNSKLISCLVAVAFAAVLVPLFAQQSPSTTNADLDRIRGDITRLKKKLEAVHAQAKTAQQELEAADLELGIQTRELQIALRLKADLDAQAAAIEQQIAELMPRIARQKAYLRERLVALYRLGGLTYVRMLMSLDQQNDPLAAVSMLSFLVNHDALTIGRFQAARQQLDIRRAELADRQQKIVQAAAVIEQRRQAIAAAHKEKERVLASLLSEETGSAQQIADLEEKARRLERLVDILSRQPGTMIPAIDIRTFRGALEWPAEGKVVEHFGKLRNAKFSTVTMNNGVKIGAAPRAPVKAIFQGTVLFSQWFKGYGNLIILDHGNRVFSLYGNVMAPLITVGDRVTTGQTIAGVGDSEDAQSGYLYFEIREDNRPEDPQKWLR